MVSPNSNKPSELGTARLSDHDLIDAAKRFILEGDAAIKATVLDAARQEISHRLRQAEVAGGTKCDVVAEILHPVFAPRGHCGCESCRESCIVCRYYGP